MPVLKILLWQDVQARACRVMHAFGDQVLKACDAGVLGEGSH